MGRSKQTGIYSEPDGSYSVDARCCGQRIRRRGFDGYAQASEFLNSQRVAVRAIYRDGSRVDMTLEQGATRLLREKLERSMPSVETDAYMLKPLVEMLGSLNLRDISNDTLAPFIEMRQAQGMKSKTINNALTVVNRICALAATSWRLPNGLTWLVTAPKVELLELTDQRPPRPITWAEQAKLMPYLPEHLQRMALFVLNTGTRDDVPCSLEWSWEIPVKLSADLTVSVFVVPRRHVKGRKMERIVVCNSVAQEVIEAQRGRHPERVFTWCRDTKPDSVAVPKNRPIGRMSNTAWQRARKDAGLNDLHVHDLRHTAGMRLRHAGVSERTQDDILWHSKKDMTSHYSVAQIREIYDALELISRESEQGETLNLLALMRRHQLRVITQNSPRQRKTA